MRRNRVGFRPAVEGIEARLLLSAAGLVTRSRPHHAAVVAQAGIDPSTIPPNPLFFPTGQPTPHEAARQRFVAKFVGPFTVGPGRFSSETQQLYIRGNGGSNQFLHGNTQLAVITPADPTQPLGGSMTMFDRNTSTNSSLGLQFVADRATDLDSAGRPIHLTIYDIKSEESGGSYASALAVGTVNIRYSPSGRRSPGVLSQGTATVTVRALIYTSGTNGILKNADLNTTGH
ncbi:hypothetical protein SAMN05444166_1219 [Singulisphaera sp. GP187]|nr:hypothetical protein SAMN05444166_1219 [Singulisphaera sp. GP187]